jgi:NADH-quinone oxidoreductase subunit F
LSTIRHFREEYIEHITSHHCRAGVCPDLVRAPCQSACPASVDIPGFIARIAEKRYAEALEVHRERNPFAAVCARVCVHPCELKCRRCTMDSPVSIRGLKRFMADQEITVQVPEVRISAKNAARKIAIIGAGPAGLTCAYFLARLGYKPKVFEASQRPGGMLVQTIPAYRLPREMLAREIRMIENLGVDIETGKALGTDFTLQDLQAQGFEAVFIGTGAPKGIILDIPGKEAEGVTESIDFLQEYNMRGSVKVGKKVVVVGGGNAAVDAARTALRLGAEVKIIYRRTQDEMPAYKIEVNEAIDEGVEIIALTNPKEISVNNGKVTGVTCDKMILGEYDASGRRRPVSKQENIHIDCDQVIFAIGQSVNADKLCQGTDLKFTNKNYIVIDPYTGQSKNPWIFAAGDVASGPLTVIEAIAGGEKAAAGIDEYLTGENHAFWRKERVNDAHFDPDADPVMENRKALPLLELQRRKNNFDEVEHTFTENDAILQAKRCLRCDYGKC